jgi:hypothetical protein
VGDATKFSITIADEASTGERTMSASSTDALRTMAATDELHISPGWWGREDVRHTTVDVVRRGR